MREGNKRIVRLKEGDPNGLHVVIVDDLINTGGTIIECQKLLKAHGAKHVSAYATHGVFPQARSRGTLAWAALRCACVQALTDRRASLCPAAVVGAFQERG